MNDREIKIEIVTERKSLTVLPGWLRGSMGRIDVDVCATCGAVVFDWLKHDDWHRGEGR